MSVLVTAEAADILGNLCLNESYSDVVFVVEGERLPAHKIILSQRSSVFKAMFPPNNELQKQVVELPEINVEAFKLLLNFIYTGTVKFGTVSFGTVFDVVSVASTYEVPRLIERCIDHLKFICAVDNVVDILNYATEKSHGTLVDHCIDYVCAHCAELISHEGFNKLPVKALYSILENRVPEVPSESIFRVFVLWMQANPSESEQFPELLKQMPLSAMDFDEVLDAIRPLNLVGDGVLLDLAYDHAKKCTAVLRQHLKDVIMVYRSKRGAANPDIEIDPAIKYLTCYKSPVLSTFKHTIGSENEATITIDLDNLYKLSNLEFILSYGDWSYWIEVSQDKVNWTRVIDYSKHVCRGIQRLFFKTQLLRYIRIGGTAPVDKVLEISRLEAEYTKTQLEVDAETNIIIPRDNVALATFNAVLTQGGDCSLGMRLG